MEIPLLSADLIKELRKLYPHRHPHLGMHEREVWFKAGQSSVVDGLEASLERQAELNAKIIKK